MSHDSLYSKLSEGLESASPQYGYNTPFRNEDPVHELIKKLVELHEIAKEKNRDKIFLQASFDILNKGSELAKILLDVTVAKKTINDQEIKDFSSAVELVTALLKNPTNTRNAEHVISQVRDLYKKTSAKYREESSTRRHGLFLAWLGLAFAADGLFFMVLGLVVTTGPISLLWGFSIMSALFGLVLVVCGLKILLDKELSPFQLSVHHNITSMYKSLIDVCGVATESEHAAYFQKQMPRDDQDAIASLEPGPHDLDPASTASTFSGSFFNSSEHVGLLSSPDVRGCPETDESASFERGIISHINQ